ncbi:hypothetical protein SprV_0401419000 [Sparganum proliferum]
MLRSQGIFGRMRIHENGIDRRPATPTTPSPTLTSSPCAPTTITKISATDTDTTVLPCPHCPRTFTSRIGLVFTCESIAQTPANQYLKPPPHPNPLSTLSPAFPCIAWAYSATCVSTDTCSRQPPAA